MSNNIKIIVPKGMSQEQVDDFLLKSISKKVDGPSNGKFDDPVMQEAMTLLEKNYEKMLSQAIKDIIKVIEDDI